MTNIFVFVNIYRQDLQKIIGTYKYLLFLRHG